MVSGLETRGVWGTGMGTGNHWRDWVKGIDYDYDDMKSENEIEIENEI